MKLNSVVLSIVVIVPLNAAPTNYYANLYSDLFSNYTKQTGPWRNASLTDDGGTDYPVVVLFDAALLAVESLVCCACSLFLFHFTQNGPDQTLQFTHHWRMVSLSLERSFSKRLKKYVFGITFFCPHTVVE